jgi:hypothetical protein
MTDVLHLPARASAPVACDMSTAADTPGERLLAYRRLFEGALLRRERRADSVVFAFRAGAGTRDAVQDLARREAACCPFLDQLVVTVEDEVIWTVSGDGRSGVESVLAAFEALPDDAGAVRRPALSPAAAPAGPRTRPAPG